MAFNAVKVAHLLAQCHRRCCVCHRFCGVKMETDHIKPLAEGGGDDIDNAIPLCFECHAEVHCYNNKHPRGRKFTQEELRQHKNQWIEQCKRGALTLAETTSPSDRLAGPLTSLVDELEYNLVACKDSLAPLSAMQFSRAIDAGSLSVVEEDLKHAIYEAYARIQLLREWRLATIHQSDVARGQGLAQLRAGELQPSCAESIANALAKINAVLQREVCY